MPRNATARTSDDPIDGRSPSTRRAARDLDATSRPGAFRRSRPVRQTHEALASRDARRMVSASGSRPVPSMRRRILGPLASISTMLVVAAMAIVTSVPANALLTPTDLLEGNLGTVGTRESQVLESTGAAAAAAVVTRDSYTVSDPAENALASRFTSDGTFVNDPDAAIQWPFKSSVPVSSGYGLRPSQPAGANPFHSGLDFNPGNGAPIQSIADGVVTSVVESDSGLGVHVTIRHTIDGDVIDSVYAHMQFGSVAVSEGQTVSVGDRVGLVGSTGQSTGPHLHFELHPDGGEAIDPYTWLKAHAG